MVDQERLDVALDKGRMDELPPNIPPGWLGEVGPNLRKADDFAPTLNAGVIQESTWETRRLVVILLYLLVVTGPVALYLLWRDRHLATAYKAVLTVVMLAGYGLLFGLVRF